jgi:hypothetical protein
MNNKSFYLKKYKEYFDISNPINNKINCEDLNNIVRLDLSQIHQFGVFANKDINKNEIITYYPAHYIYKLNEYSIYNINLILPNNFKDYVYTLDQYNNIEIIGHPDITGNMNWVGHKINDGYKHNYKSNTKKNRSLYNKKTKKYNNATFAYSNEDEKISVIVTKNIKKDEEILVSYGFDYWLHRNKILL